MPAKKPTKKTAQKAKNNPARVARKARVIGLRLRGKSVAEIAREIGMSKATVSRELSDKDAKEIIENQVRYLLQFADVATQGHIDLLVSDDPDVRHRAIELFYKVVGMFGAQTPVFIQNLYATQNNVTLTPELQRLLTQTFPQEIIDVTPYEDSSKEAHDTE